MRTFGREARVKAQITFNIIFLRPVLYVKIPRTLLFEGVFKRRFDCSMISKNLI